MKLSSATHLHVTLVSFWETHWELQDSYMLYFREDSPSVKMCAWSHPLVLIILDTNNHPKQAKCANLLWIMNSAWCYLILSWILQSFSSLQSHPPLHLNTLCPSINQNEVFPFIQACHATEAGKYQGPVPCWIVTYWPTLSWVSFAQLWVLGTCLLTWNVLQLCQEWLSIWPPSLSLCLQHKYDVISITVTLQFVVLIDSQHYQMLSLAS